MRRLLPLLLLLAASCTAPAAHGPAVVHDDLRLTDLEGEVHDFAADLAAGTPVALVFWQTWCSGCIEEAPAVVRDAHELEGRVRFVGVVPGPDDVVDAEALAERVEEFAFPYPQVRDRDLALTRRFGVEGTPTLVVLGAGGRVLYRGHGLPEDWEAVLAGAGT